MNKFLMTACLVVFTSVLLTGCFPRTRSVGVSLMPVPLQHRPNGDDERARFSVSGSGYYGHTGVPIDNVKDVNIGGGDVSMTFHLGGFFSPLFANVSLGAFRGYTGFSCSTDYCTEKERSDSEGYREWLSTPEGGDSYSTWALQERFMAGLDFNPGPYLIIGLAWAVHMYQEGGEYYRMRRNLENSEHRIANSGDGKTGSSYGLATWLGSHLGHHGEYGNFVVQSDLQFYGGEDGFISSMKYTYTHPTGFFIGYQHGSVVRHNFYFGKEFVF